MENDGDETHIDLTKGNDTIVSISDNSDSETTEISDDTKWKCENCQLLNPEQVWIFSCNGRSKYVTGRSNF